MLNVLVVDDEPKHRRGLSRMIKELRPDYEIHSAMDGKEALETIAAQPVDIVFTDIEMPVMDGLQFIECMNRRGGNESIIIMSAYSHFEYAQRAIQLGAMDYLLKPIEEERVNQTLLKAEQRVKIERSASMDTLLSRVFEGTSSREDITFLAKCCPASAGIVQGAEFSSSQGPSHLASIRREIKERLGHVFKEMGFMYNFYESDRKELLIWILTTCEDDSSIFLHTKFDEWFQRVMNKIAEDFNIELTIGAGEPFRSWDPLQVKRSYELVLLAIKSKFYYGCNVFIPANFISGRTPFSMVKLDTGVMMRAIQAGDKETALNSLRVAIDRVLEKSLPSPDKLVLSVAASIHHLHVCLSEKGHVVSDIVTHEEAILKSKSWAELWHAAQSWVLSLANQLDNKKQKRNESIIDTCKSYIEGHYAEELSLSTLAEKFHFNASYFCMLFKNNTNTTVSQFIIQTRMNRAASMLKQTSLKVYEIAAMVGYKDVKYFIRLFRKEYGASPDEFRHITATR
ncbi:response regulator [Paenibacillus sp. R14(2021)]|uniref:response regulator transcription factor n=1 Tax=Paenibacillus sp. R14(2021) TaxID=2859228 RepID=UPI001C615521|nr:response regulator [Paenibacillus sp. R14(2021)]